MSRTAVRLLAAVGLLQPAVAGTTLTVTHGNTPEPTYSDRGSAGDSVGDQRMWEFSGNASGGQAVTMEWIMIATGQADAAAGLERRVTTGLFSLGDAGGDQIVIEGVGRHPTAGSTVKADPTLDRAVLGGTGKYAGARGTVEISHLPDGTWQHVFTLEQEMQKGKRRGDWLPES